eukprot:Awhi_evm2s14141
MPPNTFPPCGAFSFVFIGKIFIGVPIVTDISIFVITITVILVILNRIYFSSFPFSSVSRIFPIAVSIRNHGSSTSLIAFVDFFPPLEGFRCGGRERWEFSRFTFRRW